MREVVEELWPELAHKLPPKIRRGWPTVIAGECPLYPRKRTSSDTTGTSALCQSRL